MTKLFISFMHSYQSRFVVDFCMNTKNLFGIWGKILHFTFQATSSFLYLEIFTYIKCKLYAYFSNKLPAYSNMMISISVPSQHIKHYNETFTWSQFLNQ